MRQRIRVAGSRTFRSLHVRNYRLFFWGQLVSVTGTWMQTVAQNWLVLSLTNSGLSLGVTVALQFLPMLLFGMWGGLVADRYDKRRVLVATQAVSGVLALTLWALVAAGVVELWMVYVLAFLLGCATAVDMPTRQAFVVEMVGAQEVPNAVGLNSAVFNTGRLLGPAAAALVISSLGIAPSFLLNALSYVAVIAGLVAMRPEELHRQARAEAAKGELLAGIRYVWNTPVLRSTLLLVAVLGTFGFNFIVILPLMARFTFHADAGLYGVLTSLMSGGSLVGALFAAGATRPTRRRLVSSALAFASLTLVAAAAPTPAAEAAVLVGVGLAMMIFMATANTTLQLNTSELMRGRVMALYALVFLGSTPVGGPLVGWISGRWGARAGMALCGTLSLGAALVAVGAHQRRRRAGQPAEADDLAYAV